MTSAETSGRKEPKRESSKHQDTPPKGGESRDLDAEIVKDLELDDRANDIRGGPCPNYSGTKPT
jgi:hypothetical protein